MGVTVGSGDYRYEVIEGWGKLPDGWTFREVAAVALDKKDQIYAFTRGQHPIIVFDRDGNFLRSWGEGTFKRAHGATMGPDETIYLTDDGDHTVRKCTLDGKVLFTLGVPGKPALYSCRFFSKGRDLCVGRLRQFPRAQILARWKTAFLVGRTRMRSRSVQYRSQHLHR